MFFLQKPSRSLFTMIFVGLFLIHTLFAIPLNNVYETQPLYSYLLSDKFYKKRESAELRLNITPLYQHANTARNADGRKVAGGDRFEQMNMFGLFFDKATLPPTGKTFNSTYYPVASPAQVAVAAVVGAAVEADNPYKLGADSTDAALFKKQNNPFAYLSVPISYEKIGVRGQMNYDLAFGLGLAVRGGAADIKCKPRDFVLDPGLQADSIAVSDTGYASAKALVDALFSDQQRDAVAQDFNINLKTFRSASVEDVHVQLYWHYPINSMSSATTVGVVIVPYLAAGVWLPTGKKANQDKYFAVPFGNESGEYGLTLDGSLGIDFPLVPSNSKQSLGFSLGGGVLLFAEQELLAQRFPSTSLQTGGLFPFKAEKLKKQPGETWYTNVGFKAEQFIEGFSFYADYTYTNHTNDRVTVKDTDAKKALFDKGVASYQENSSWKNQQIAVGLNFAMTDAVAFSFAAQAHISGVRVIRTVAMLGGLSVTF